MGGQSALSKRTPQNRPDDTPKANTSPLLVQPTHLRRWRAALGKGLLGVGGRPVINVYGHSIATGAKAQDTSSSTPDLLWAQYGYATQLRKLFASTYGDPGEGYVRLRDEPRATFGGGAAAVSSYGPYMSGVSVTSAKSITLTLPQCTQIDVLYWWDNANTQTFTTTVDGGGAVTSPTKNAASTFYTQSLTGLADTTHTLVITGTSGTVGAAISAVVARRGTAGVEVNRIAQSGATTADLVGSALSTSSQDVLQRATQLIVPCDLATFDIAANDYLAQSPTPTQFKANVKKFTDYQTAAGGCSLLIAGSRRDDAVAPGPTPTYTQQTYFDQLQALANENDHVAFLDLGPMWGTLAQARSAGLVVDTSIHPGSKGHGDIARTLHRVLTGLGMGQT